MTLSDLENAILKALAPLLKEPGNPNGIALTLDSYAGQLDNIHDLAVRAGIRRPCLYLAYGGGPLNGLNLAAGLYDHQPEFVVLAGVDALRGDLAARQGRGQVGLNSIAARVFAALSGKQLDLEIRPIEFQGIDLLDWDEGLMVFGLRFITRFPWKIAEEAEG